MNIATLTLTVTAGGALTANRFVTGAGAAPSANGRALGVTRTGATASGDLVPVDVMGTTLVEASAAIAAEAQVATTSDGRAVTFSTGAVLARVAPGSSATAAGQLIEVLLIPN